MRATQLLLTSVLSLAVLGGCDGGEKKDDKAADAETKKEEAPKKPMADLFPGKSVELPPPLAKLELGAAEEKAEKVLAGITTKLVDLEGYEGDISVGSFSSERGPAKVLMSVRLSLPNKDGDVEKMLTEKWGAPRKIKDLSDMVPTWFNAEKGLRARLKKGYGEDKIDLEFSAYLPFEKLIGTDKNKFGFENEPLLGMNLEGLTKNYGDVLEQLTKEQAEKKRAEMRKMFGDSIDQLGEATASTDIKLLPTELESFTTTVWPTFNKETKTIESVRMTVPFEEEEGADKRMLDAMKKVWGEPKEEEKYGKKVYVFSEEPFLTVKDSIGRSWEIERQLKRR